ncbi:MAG: extracellular solute-binding protein [Pseudomonadota bacterium]
MALTAGAASAQDYSAYEGTTLVVNFPAHPHYTAVQKVLPQFTEETGIEVEVDELQYLRMRDAQLLEMSKPEGDYDLISYVVFWKTEYADKRLVEPLAYYKLDPTINMPDYDADDLITGYVQNISQVGGEKGYLPGGLSMAIGVPFGSETSVLGYRKDIFEKHGLEVPETYDELMELACQIPELEPGMGGLASRGQSNHQAVHAWLLHLAPQGGAVFDENFRPVVNNEIGVKAAEQLKSILECGPEGGTSFGFAESSNAFLQGSAAMYLDSISIAAAAEDPERSEVVGQVGWALHPMGTERASQTGGFGIAIPSNSRNKEAAYLLMQWLTSKKGDKLIAMAGGSPSRFSTYNDPELQEMFPHYAVFAEALKYADPDWRPIIPEWGEINAPNLGVAIGEIVNGETPAQEALDAVAARIEGIMENAGYYGPSE